ncbi:MAG: phosphatase PAP2 family protein [Chloroflexota bacterium]
MIARRPWQQVRPFLLALYVAVVAVAFLYFNVRLTVEWVALILLVAAIVSGRGFLFIRDWGVFVVVLLAWQIASALAARSPFSWHLVELIKVDKVLFFGTVPSQWLQEHLYHPGVIEPWDVLATCMYMLHFFIPLLCGFVLWLVNRDRFRQFALAFVLVALAGFGTYILYPAVPPWMAAESLLRVHHRYLESAYGHVYLPHVRNLFNATIQHWFNAYDGSGKIAFLHSGYDKVGAMPSEHAAYPMLFFLFLRKQFGRPAYLAILYIVTLLFSITYLGQHYVVDALVGFAYAIAGYATIVHAVPALRAYWAASRNATAIEAWSTSGLEEA